MSKLLLKKYEYHLKFVEQRSAATIDAYLSDLKVLSFVTEGNFIYIKSDQLQDIFYQWSKEVSQSSLARRLSSIRHFYQYLVETKEIDQDPSQTIRVNQKGKKLPHYFTLDEIKQLIDFDCEDYDDFLDKAIILTLFSTGLRVSELINLTHQRFYRQEEFFKVIGKGSKERIVPIGKQALISINDYLAKVQKPHQQGYLFVNSKSLPLTRQSVYNRLSKRASQMGMTKPISPHVLRHSFASAMINHDADLRVVQELLGHEVISTTQIYTHLETHSKKRMYEQFHPGAKLKKGLKNEE